MSGCVSGHGERERSFPIVTVPRGSSERERSFPSVTEPEEVMWTDGRPGVGPGKTFVMRSSRWGGSVGGCVWLVLCVLMMSSWDDGDTDVCDLVSDLGGAVPGNGAVAGLPWSARTFPTRRFDAEEIGGAVFGHGAAVDLMWRGVHMWNVVDVSVWCVSSVFPMIVLVIRGGVRRK